MENDNVFVALLGDAVGSRELDATRRVELQGQLAEALGEINRRWAGAIAARFAIALGDQFEGLLTGAAPVWDIAHLIRARADEVDWIIVAARGRISTPLAGTAPEVDGPVFHAARETLEDAKRHRRVLAFRGFGGEITGPADYYSALYWSWTARQRRVASRLRIMEPAAAAEQLGVHRSAVSHLMRRLGWDLVAAGDQWFRQALEAE